jgi:hypothetical protein
MSDVNIEYDRIHFEIVGQELIAHDNIVIEESLSEEDDLSLSGEGYLIRRIDDQNYWVISARLDSDGLMRGVEEMHRFVRNL